MIIKINIPFSNQFFLAYICIVLLPNSVYTLQQGSGAHVPFVNSILTFKKNKRKKTHRRTASAWCDANDNSHLLCASCSGLERISVASTATLQTHSVLQTSDLQDARTNTSIHTLTISIWPPHSEE